MFKYTVYLLYGTQILISPQNLTNIDPDPTEWELTRASVREVVKTQWSPAGSTEDVRFMAFTFHLSRLPLYYTTYLIVPTICVTGLVIVVFHLPNIGGEKITLSISVLLGKRV